MGEGTPGRIAENGEHVHTSVVFTLIAGVIAASAYC